jgi:Cupredoxin-like domain
VVKPVWLLFLLMPGLALAQVPEVQLRIKDHRFIPAEVRVPAKQRVKLVVTNEDPTPEEFDSYALNREKVIAGGTRGVLYIGPLAPGRYEFIGEFHQATAKGAVVAE